ncbi:MAG: tetratricopeptide repeat protein [Elusimicrobiaceae bacterium]|nr:tetratricopeptide repeat protein [Elusimicrobiaceae bacterium]
MRKILIFSSIALLFGVIANAQEAQTALDFYKKELVAFPVQSTQETRAYAQSLADGLQTWLLQNENHPAAQDALLLQARLRGQARQNGSALVNLFRLRYLFPQADLTNITSLFEEALTGLDKKYRSQASQLLMKGPSAQANQPGAREAETLYAFSKLKGKDFYPAAAQAFEQFFARYPKYAGNNEVELWYGDLHRTNDNYLAAIAQYKKADALYPNSAYKAASLRLIGDIYADNLKNTPAATEAYTRVLRLFPNSSETGIVYKHMAILDENNKQYDSALINYDKAIELLGPTPAAYEAYRGKADVCIKTKQYEEAYRILHQTAEFFQADKAKSAQALMQAATIARKQLRDDVKYVQSLQKAVLLQPTDSTTAPRLYELGQAYEKQGKTAAAQETYKKLILQFPTSSYTSSAQRRLNRLTK